MQDQTSAIEAALARAEQAYVAANPLSRARHERARKVLRGHSRQALYFAPFPLTFASGHGAHLTDLDNHEYLNWVDDYAAGVYGHTCIPIQQAVAAALQDGVSLGGLNAPEVGLAELITRRIPSIEELRFCSSGSEACLFAAQLARQVTRREKLLMFDGSYHGSFMTYRATAPPLTAADPPLSIPFPRILATYNEVAGTRALLRSNAADIAAVIVEPMLGMSGAIPGTPDFLAMLREETRRLGIVLVFDEVLTSRLAPGGVQGLRGIHPDLTVLGKFWGGGLAFGALGGSRELMHHLDTSNGGLLEQGGTFNDDVLALGAGLVGARDVFTPEACIKLNSLGDSLRLQLNALGRSVGLSFHATGLGGVLSTHWNEAGITEPSRVEPASAPMRRLFQLEMIAHGHYVSQNGLIALSLPMTDSDIKGFVAAVREYLTQNVDILPRSSK